MSLTSASPSRFEGRLTPGRETSTGRSQKWLDQLCHVEARLLSHWQEFAEHRQDVESRLQGLQEMLRPVGPGGSPGAKRSQDSDLERFQRRVQQLSEQQDQATSRHSDLCAATERGREAAESANARLTERLQAATADFDGQLREAARAREAIRREALDAAKTVAKEVMWKMEELGSRLGKSVQGLEEQSVRGARRLQRDVKTLAAQVEGGSPGRAERDEPPAAKVQDHGRWPEVQAQVQNLSEELIRLGRESATGAARLSKLESQLQECAAQAEGWQSALAQGDERSEWHRAQLEDLRGSMCEQLGRGRDEAAETREDQQRVFRVALDNRLEETRRLADEAAEVAQVRLGDQLQALQAELREQAREAALAREEVLRESLDAAKRAGRAASDELQRKAEELGGRFGEVSQGVEEQCRRLEQRLQQDLRDLATRVEATRGSAEEAPRKLEVRLEAARRGHAGEVQAKLDDVSGEAARLGRESAAGNARLSKLEARLQDCAAQSEGLQCSLRQGEEHAEWVRSQLEDVRTCLSDQVVRVRDDVSAMLHEQQRVARAAIEGRLEESHEHIRQVREELARSAEDARKKSDSLKESMREGNLELAALQTAFGSMERHVEQLEKSADAACAAAEGSREDVVKGQRTLHHDFGQQLKQACAQMDDQLQLCSKDLSMQLEGLRSGLDDVRGTSQADLSQLDEEIDQLRRAVGDHAQGLTALEGECRQRMDHGDQALRQFREASEQREQRLRAATLDLTEQMSVAHDDVLRVCRERTDEALNTVEQLCETRVLAVEEGQEELHDKMSHVQAAFSDQVASSSDQTKRMCEDVRQQSRAWFNDALEQCEVLAMQLRDLAGEKADKADVARLRSHDIREKCRAAVEDVRAACEARSKELAQRTQQSVVAAVGEAQEREARLTAQAARDAQELRKGLEDQMRRQLAALTERLAGIQDHVAEQAEELGRGVRELGERQAEQQAETSEDREALRQAIHEIEDLKEGSERLVKDHASQHAAHRDLLHEQLAKHSTHAAKQLAGVRDPMAESLRDARESLDEKMTRLEKKTEEQRREFERSMKSLEADAERQLQELRQQLFARAAEGEKAAARAKASVDDLQQDLLTRVKEGEAQLGPLRQALEQAMEAQAKRLLEDNSLRLQSLDQRLAQEKEHSDTQAETQLKTLEGKIDSVAERAQVAVKESEAHGRRGWEQAVEAQAKRQAADVLARFQALDQRLAQDKQEAETHWKSLEGDLEAISERAQAGVKATTEQSRRDVEQGEKHRKTLEGKIDAGAERAQALEQRITCERERVDAQAEDQRKSLESKLEAGAERARTALKENSDSSRQLLEQALESQTKRLAEESASQAQMFDQRLAREKDRVDAQAEALRRSVESKLEAAANKCQTALKESEEQSRRALDQAILSTLKDSEAQSKHALEQAVDGHGKRMAEDTQTQVQALDQRLAREKERVDALSDGLRRSLESRVDTAAERAQVALRECEAQGKRALEQAVESSAKRQAEESLGRFRALDQRLAQEKEHGEAASRARTEEAAKKAAALQAQLSELHAAVAAAAASTASAVKREELALADLDRRTSAGLREALEKLGREQSHRDEQVARQIDEVRAQLSHGVAEAQRSAASEVRGLQEALEKVEAESRRKLADDLRSLVQLQGQLEEGVEDIREQLAGASARVAHVQEELPKIAESCSRGLQGLSGDLQDLKRAASERHSRLQRKLQSEAEVVQSLGQRVAATASDCRAQCGELQQSCDGRVANLQNEIQTCCAALKGEHDRRVGELEQAHHEGFDSFKYRLGRCEQWLHGAYVKLGINPQGTLFSTDRFRETLSDESQQPPVLVQDLSQPARRPGSARRSAPARS